MPQTITNTAKLQCNQGTLQTPLQVTSQTFDCINGEPIATEQDNKPNANIKPFGQCRLKPTSSGYLPCVPVPIKWQDTSPFEINGQKELLDCSKCPCSIGGIISVVESNQKFVEE